MKKRRPSRRWDRRGVSEIIANLLILGITVTLFSSVLMFVTQMPPPKQEVYTDFSATTEIQPATGNCWINVTNKGGQVLSDFRTKIYILKDEQAPLTLKFSDSLVNIGSTWDTGEMWVYRLTSVTDSTRLSIMIIDYVSNSMVWSSALRGEAGAFPPIIGARGTYGEPVFGSPTYAEDKTRFYATVMDPDGNLRTNSVYIDATSLVGISDKIQLHDLNSDGVFISDLYTADSDWNNMTVIVNATDQTNRNATARITLDIQLKPGEGQTQYGPFYNYSAYFVNGTYPPDVSGGESGGGTGGAGTTFYYVRRYSDYAITRQFIPNERVLIEIYSDALANLALQNSFTLYHPITGEIITPQSTETDAFQYGGIYSTFYRYVYTFDAPSEAYIYPFQMKAKDNYGVIINILDTISVSGGAYPKLVTYRNETNALVQSSGFNHTDTVYLKIPTMNVDALSSAVYVSDIEISDYSGRYIVKKTPPTYAYPPLAYSTPVSCVHKTGNTPTPNYETTPQGTYTIRINLNDAYQGWWLPRTNWYTVRIGLFTDSNEVYNQLSCQINVTAPLTTMDILASVGQGSFTWSSSGAQWDNNAVKWYKFTEEWDETTIADSDDGSLPSDGPIGMALADLDGDGDSDVVVGTQDNTQPNIIWYENFKVDGSSWSDPRTICAPFDARSGLQHRTGSITDRSGTANEDSSVWSTARSTDQFENGYYSQNELCGAMAVGDFDGDGDGDVVASFIHVVVYTDATGSGDADYTNTWGMYFNRGIYVFWNDGSWTKNTLYGTTDFLAANNDNMDTNPAAMDVAVADFNLDGYDDIVGVYESGVTKVWLNKWGVIDGSIATHQNKAFGSDGIGYTVRTIAAYTGTNTLPWSHVQYPVRVEAARVNTDNYPDIVRTNTGDKSITVYYTLPSVSDQVFANATAEWSYNSNCSSSGTLANLSAGGDSYESLTEAYKVYGASDATAQTAAPDDNTGEALVKLAYDDGNPYKVDKNEKMNITYWTVDAAYLGRKVASAELWVKYSTESGYTINSQIEWALSGGSFQTTGIQPKNGDLNVVASYTLPASVSTYNDVANLDVRFDNLDTNHYVEIEYMIIKVTFVETREMGWVWKIPNSDRAYHNLTIEAKRGGPTTEGFRLSYSVDNTTWFNLANITAISDTIYTFELTYTPSDYYYVRIMDTDRSTADVTNDTFKADRLYIRHWMQNVDWSTAQPSYYYRYTFPLGGSADPKASNYYQLAGLAVGDVGKTWDNYEPDGLPDIIVCTSKIAVGGTYEALYIMCQQTPQAFDTRPVISANLNILCPIVGSWGSSSYQDYDGKDIELGDYDGDNDLDLILVVGYRFGTSTGSGPTLWLYENEQRYLSGGGQWQLTESYLSLLITKGDSAINVETGNIDLAVFLPFLGVLGVVAAEVLVGRKKRD